MLYTRLHGVIAAAAGLERIDPYRLLARQPGSRRDTGIGAFELNLACGLLRRPLEILARRLQEIADHWNRLVLPRRPCFRRLRFGIHRPLRPGIDRRLREHVVVERDGEMLAPFGVTATTLLHNRIPISARLFLERAGRESAAHRRAVHAVSICATAACVVFAVLGSSTLPVLRSIGITVVLGVASNFVLAQLLIRRRSP